MTRLHGWETQDRGGDSRQRVLSPDPLVEATPAGALRLAETYWLAVRRTTLGAVRGRWHPGGGDLRLLGVLPLLRFGPPRVEAAGARVSCAHEIRGGLLAAGAGGRVAFEQRPAGEETEVIAAVEGYRPRLPPALHARLQRRLHLSVSRRFFALLDERAG